MPGRDFIPTSFVNRHTWLVTLKAKVIEFHADWGWSAADLTAFNAFIDPLIAAYADVLAKIAALETATGDALDLFNNNEHALREKLNEIKNTPGFTPGQGDAMHIFTEGSATDPANVKPRCVVKSEFGSVFVSGSKDGAELVTIRMRVVGDIPWRTVATNRKRLPFEDQTPLKVPGVPEVREYRMIGINNDIEVGQPSDIVQVTHAG